MKRLVAILVLCLTFVLCVIGFTACSITNSGNNGDNSSATETVDAQIKSVYNMYVASAEANGEKPISYETWLATIKGEKGEKGEKGDKGDDGVTPTIEISDDGFWIINGVKTEYKAIGADGKDGVDGKDGTGENTAAENPQELDFYPKDDGTYEVYVGKAKLLSNLVIPATYKGKAVTSIGDIAFGDCRSLTSITIPDSVTNIGYRAFKNCSSLTSITIPDSVTSIGNCAFCGCGSLTSITVDEDNEYYKSIDGNVYSKDGTILIQYAIGKTETEFTIPDSVTSIGDYAFSNCSKLTSINIPDSVTSIGNGAFEYCSSLQYNEYDNGYYLGNRNNPYLALIEAKSTDITSCTIHNDTKIIAGSAFSYCYSLTSINIPDSVTSIGNGAFEYCSSLTSITIPDSVTSIGSYAFAGCSSLSEITIPDSVTSIGNYAFSGCSSLTSITFNGTKGQWNAIEKGGSSWKYNSAITQVVCTDGTI